MMRSVRVAMGKTQEKNKEVDHQATGSNVVSENIPTEQTPPLPIKIPPKILEQAKMLGIDLGQIVDWAASVESRFAQMEQVLTCGFEKVGVALKDIEPLAAAVKKANEMRQQAPPAADPQGQGLPVGPLGGLDIGSLIKLVGGVLGNGSAPSADQELAALGNQYGKMVLQNAINDLQNPKPNPFEEIGREVILKISAKRANQAAEELTKD